MCHFAAYRNAGLLNIDDKISAHGINDYYAAPNDKAEVFKMLLDLGTAAYLLYNVFFSYIG